MCFPLALLNHDLLRYPRWFVWIVLEYLHWKVVARLLYSLEALQRVGLSPSHYFVDCDLRARDVRVDFLVSDLRELMSRLRHPDRGRRQVRIQLPHL